MRAQQTSNRQNRADPEQLRGRVLDGQNADTSQCLQNLFPKWPPVVALSSNGACGSINRFGCPKHDPGAALDRPDSVCLCVCLFVPLFAAHFLDRFWTETIPIFRKKITQKRELEPVSVGEADHFHATLPRSLHSPQVATAAPPSPLGPIGGVAVETCT